MRILASNTSAIMIDIQEVFTPHIFEIQKLIKNSGILVQGLSLLDIPIMITEQNPTKLGSTVPELISNSQHHDIISKNEFSCYDNDICREKLDISNRKNIILFGVEAHICILQTAIDLKENGYTPIIIKDAISSRNPQNIEIAIQRLLQEGCIISSYESILFELLRDFTHPHARDISKLIK